MANARQPQEEQAPTPGSLYMEFFKQIGTLSLAGGPLMVTLYGVFGTPGVAQTLVTCVGVLAFSLSLMASVFGMWLLVEDWSSRGRMLTPHRAEYFIAFARGQGLLQFLLGVLCFMVMANMLVFTVLPHS